MGENTVEFKAKPVKCVYNSDTFKVYATNVDMSKYPFVKRNKWQNVSISGDISELTLGVEYEITAVEEKTKYGIGYKVLNIRRDIPTDSTAVKEFLNEILTENQAAVLYDEYPDIIDIVKNDKCDTVDLSKLYGIGEKTFEKIKTKIIENFKLVDLVGEFKGAVSLGMIRKIYDKYPDVNMLRAKLKEKPYETLTKLSGVGFIKADNIVLKLQKDGIVDFGYNVETSTDRCLACVIYFLQENEEEGNTHMNLADLRSKCIKLVPASADHFAKVILSNDIYYNKEDMEIGLAETYCREKHIAEVLASNIETNDTWDYDIEKYRSVEEFELSDEQMKAVSNLCKFGISILNGFAGCVDCDTEFFNGSSWKRIADYDVGDKVLQYNEDGTAELTYPNAYIKNECEYLWHFSTKYGLDQCLSDNHNCYYITSKGNLYHKSFKKIREDQERNGFHGKFITSFNYSGEGVDLSDDEIRLMVATFADGGFYYRDNCSENTYNQSRFHLKKDRKKQRLVDIANKANVKCERRDSAAEGYDDYYIKVPFRAKHYPKEWYNCNKHQLQVIADEVMFWDGNHKKNNCYSTTCKEDADFIQFVYSALGYRATISVNDRVGQEHLTGGKTYTRKSIEYVVSYTNRTLVGMCHDKRENRVNTKILPYKTLDGYEYCFTVPSHMLVLRRNGKIFITGNCGKSFTTKSLINMLKDNKKTFILAAPTGKAAKVLSEYTNEKASTIHRALGYNPKMGWMYNKYNELPYDVVLIDEFSMCDVKLFVRLLDAIDFTRTKLVLVGDNAQLPSVGCGNLLHDFMESSIVPTATLTKIFRYGEGGLMKVATDIRCCKPYLDKSMSGKATQFGANKDYAFIDSDSKSIPKTAVALYKKLLDAGNDVKDIQILTAKNIGDCGTIVLNNMVQKEVNKNYGSLNCIKAGDIVYYDGDLVMQIENNYNAVMCDEYGKIMQNDFTEEVQTAFVANGETGVVVRACKDFAVINFDGVTVLYDKSMISTVRLGYVCTIHKSQGSGIDNVILCTPKSDTFMLNSNLLYVGITRTRKKCYHLGTLTTVNNAVRKKENLTRHTFMQDLLKEFKETASNNKGYML